MTHVATQSFIDELTWRGLFYQSTADEPLRRHLATPGRIAYCGFDPSADSLHVGHLIPIKLLMHWQQAGHKPIALVGGGTGMIGDPSGKDSERQLLTRDHIEANVEGIRRVFGRLLDCEPANPNAATVVNNIDWLGELGFIEVLRDVGKYFSVNAMIQKDSVRDRLENREQGISYTEFSYMLLQSYDFLHLHRVMNCTVQMAGSDQFGNIVGGVDLIHRNFGHEAEAYGITAPLLLRSDGKKFGKSESGAVWLTADRTSPYAFYQFWINADDADVVNLLKRFTMLDQETVTDLATRHEAVPHERIAQRALADHMTDLVHGADELERAKTASSALFSGDVSGLDAATLTEVFADVPHTTHDRASLEGDGVSLIELLPGTSLANSKREAREFLGNGAVSVNGEKAAADRTLKTADLLHGTTILLRRGKKSWHGTKWDSHQR